MEENHNDNEKIVDGQSSQSSSFSVSAGFTMKWSVHSEIKAENVFRLSKCSHDAASVVVSEVAELTVHRALQELAAVTKSMKRMPPTTARLAVEIAPGFGLHRWLSSCCPRSFKENVLDELLATGTLMYQEALAERNYSAARRVRWAMRFWMLRAMA